MNIFRFLQFFSALCLCLFLPLAAGAAPDKNASAQKSDSPAVASASKSESLEASAKSSQAAEAKKSADDEEKRVWLKRAQESDIYTGKASWYGRDFHNKKTASGINYDMYTFTAAHRTLPLGTVVKVTDQHNGKNVLVCITDRGPYVRGRIIDLSFAAAQRLDLEERGVSKVALEVLSDEKGAPLKSGCAYYVKYNSDTGKKEAGPYGMYSDAAAMHEAIRQAHPDAEVVMKSLTK